MGNCMETCINRQQIKKEKQLSERREAENGILKEIKGSNIRMRVKIVLTKEELEWFMLQLKDNNNNNNQEGRSSLEDVLGEIERGRAKLLEGGSWSPSLESIMESPEVLDHMDRS